MVFTVPAEEVPSLNNTEGIQVFSTPSMRVVDIGLNTLDPILSDVRVRQALSHATDLDQVDAIIGDNGVKATGIVLFTAACLPALGPARMIPTLPLPCSTRPAGPSKATASARRTASAWRSAS